MTSTVGSESKLWRMTFVFAGVGSTFLGPLLPTLEMTWRLRDHQAGFLVSCLFAGSFTGTMLLSPMLRRTLTIGSWSACIGLLLFAWCVARNPGITVAAGSLALMGFGLGQLMSSINLLVGSGDERKRAANLAGIAAAFCIGAILSPALAAVSFNIWPTPIRFGVFALFFLLPILWIRGRELPASRRATTMVDRQSVGLRQWNPAWRCIFVFLIYGGVEACVGNWLPLFATRYQLGVIGRAQWITSVFWIGLGSGRFVMSRYFNASSEERVLRISLVGSAACLIWLIVFPSPIVLLLACAAEGVCLGPIFPLILSSAIGYGLSARNLGIALAACGLGAAVFPVLFGLAASGWSLRTGMLVPICGLCLLLLLQWHSSLKTLPFNPVPQN
jgi:MFS transporter, FHS family, glucose/mannose:H+ symporter